jgi:cytochrome c-type biogenesis protein CcmE
VFAGAPDRDDIGGVVERQRVNIGGLVVEAVVRKWVGGDVLECRLDDGTGQMWLAFLGRRQVDGVVSGALLSAEGVVGTHRGRRLVLNPLITFWTPG